LKDVEFPIAAKEVFVVLILERPQSNKGPFTVGEFHIRAHDFAPKSEAGVFKKSARERGTPSPGSKCTAIFEG
jgi:hypothetical protein